MENVVKRTLIFVVGGAFFKNYSCRFLLLLLYLRITVAFLFTISLLNISVDRSIRGDSKCNLILIRIQLSFTERPFLVRY